MGNEKVGIIDSLDKLVFDEKDKFARISLNRVGICSNGQKYDFNQGLVYVKNNGKFEPISNVGVEFVKNFDWGRDYYFYNEYYRYGSYQVNRNEQMQKLDNFHIILYLSYQTYVSYDQYVNNNRYNRNDNIIEYNIYNNDMLYEKKFYIVSNNYKNLRPHFYDMKVGDSYIFGNNGKSIITKIYDYPNKENLFCEIKTANDEEKRITYNELSLIDYLPYDDTYESKVKFLNNNLNEVKLLPYLVIKDGKYNLYWKKIDDASNYIVGLYKVASVHNVSELYLLNEYVIDRNTCFLTLDNLIGGNFVFKLYAENRNGERIAESRAIANGIPTYVEEDII